MAGIISSKLSTLGHVMGRKGDEHKPIILYFSRLFFFQTPRHERKGRTKINITAGGKNRSVCIQSVCQGNIYSEVNVKNGSDLQYGDGTSEIYTEIGHL